MSSSESMVLYGRVLGVRAFKSVVFVTIACEHGTIQCVAPQKVPVGSYVKATGEWRRFKSKNETANSMEFALLVPFEVLWKPVDTPDRGAAAQLSRLATIREIRGSAIAKAVSSLGGKGFAEIAPTLIVGSRANLGATLPFTAACGNESAFLTVNTVINHIAAIASGGSKTCSVSRLCWAQRYNDRVSLNEITAVEFALVDASESALMDLAEVQILGIQEYVLGNSILPFYLASRIDHPGLRFDPLTEHIPRITHQEILEMANVAGIRLSPQSHALPRAVDDLVFEEFSCNAYWVTQQPAGSVPAYVLKEDGLANSFELRVRDIGNVCSGSEWDLQNASGWLESLQVSKVVPTPSSTEKGGGVTLGVDRLLMHWLSESRISSVFFDSPRVSNFVNAPNFDDSSAEISAQLDPLESTAYVNPLELVVSEMLKRFGYAQVFTSVFDRVASGLVAVDYFGATAFLRSDPFSIRSSASPEFPRVFEIGPYFDREENWTHGSRYLSAFAKHISASELEGLEAELKEIISMSPVDLRVVSGSDASTTICLDFSDNRCGGAIR